MFEAGNREKEERQETGNKSPGSVEDSQGITVRWCPLNRPTSMKVF